MTDKEQVIALLDKAGESYERFEKAGNSIVVNGAVAFVFTATDELLHILGGDDWDDYL